MTLFTVVGVVIFIFTVILAIVSRIYELRIFWRHGLQSIDDYRLFLKMVEADGVESEFEHEHKLTQDDIKNAMEEVKRKVNKARFDKRGEGLLRKTSKSISILLGIGMGRSRAGSDSTNSTSSPQHRQPSSPIPSDRFPSDHLPSPSNDHNDAYKSLRSKFMSSSSSMKSLYFFNSPGSLSLSLSLSITRKY